MSLIFNREIHKRYLSLLLSDIVKTFPERVAFKGGTCAALFYNLPRFSFDLDFDLLYMFSLSNISELKELLSRYGEIKDFYNKKYTLFFLFDYGKGYPKIKIELNKRVWKNNIYKPAWFLGVALSIAEEATMLTNKIVALTERKSPAARDLYDSWYFLKAGYSLSDALIQERTGKSKQEYLKSAASFIKKNYTSRNVLQGLGETLDDKQKIWAKAHLINEAVTEIEKLII